MSISDFMNTEFLRKNAWKKANPEFAQEVQELKFASEHTARMLKAGKLTAKEASELEAHFCEKLIEALPVDDFHKMMADGTLLELQALAGHDGTRDADDVADNRKSLMTKITRDLLDDAWLNQKITSERYARENAELQQSEELNNRIADGDHDGAASEFFAGRHDVSDHDAQLNKYLDKTYGEDRPGREKPAEDKAPKAVREPVVEKYDDKKSFQENLSEHLGRHREEPPPVKDATGIIDLDALAEQEG